MSDTLFEIYIHIVFSTINGVNLIPEALIPRLHGYIATIFSRKQCHDICVGGTSNHVHILTSLPKVGSVSEVVKTVKLSTNKMLVEQCGLNKFSWQKGYAVFSVSPPEIIRVKNYIRNQKQHHIQTSYNKEIEKLAMLCKYIDR